MTELLNSSYNYQEPYKYMTNLRCREMEPSITNEYLEYKTFYEEDENSQVQVIKRIKTINSIDDINKNKFTKIYIINSSKLYKSLSFFYQK
jgi:hypothetical protein